MTKRSCAHLRFVSDKALEGRKEAVISGQYVHVSPAIYSLLKGPEAKEVMASLEFLEAPPAGVTLGRTPSSQADDDARRGKG